MHEELEGDTIIVDTGGLEGPNSGDLATISRRSQRARHHAHSAIESPPIPKTYAKAMSNPRYRAHWEQAISEELTKL